MKLSSAAILASLPFGLAVSAESPGAQVIEEIVVTAPYPAHLIMEEIVVVAPKRIDLLTDEVRPSVDRHDAVAWHPELSLRL